MQNSKPTPAFEAFRRLTETLRSGFPVSYRVAVFSFQLLLTAFGFLLGLFSDFLQSVKGVLVVIALALVCLALVALLNLLVRYFIESLKRSQPVKAIGSSIIVVIALLLLSVVGIVVGVTYQIMAKGVTTSRESKNAIQPEFQKLWDEDKGDANKLQDHASTAFDAGGYGYVIMFHERSIALDRSPNTLTAKPLYAYAKLATNPTPKGNEEFRQILTSLVESLKLNKKYDNLIDSTLTSFNKVRNRLTEKSDRDFLDQKVEEIIEMRRMK